VKPPKVMEFLRFANKINTCKLQILFQRRIQKFSLESIFVIIYNISRNLLNKVALYSRKNVKWKRMKYMQVINSPLMSKPWLPTSRNQKKNSIDRAIQKNKPIVALLFTFKLNSPKSRKKYHLSGKEKNTCIL